MDSEREAKRARLDIDLNVIDMTECDASQGPSNQLDQTAQADETAQAHHTERPLIDLNVAPLYEPDVEQTNNQQGASSSGMIAEPSSSRFAGVRILNDPFSRPGSTNLFTPSSYINSTTGRPTNTQIQREIVSQMAPNLGLKTQNQSTLIGGESWQHEQPLIRKPLSNKLPADLIGDVFLIQEFLYEFKPLLGLQQVPSFEELETELLAPRPETSNQTMGNSNSAILTEIHTKILQLLLSEVLPLVSISMGPTRRVKKDAESSAARRTRISAVPVLNELTWPELARRFALVTSSLGKCVDWSDFSLSFSEGMRIFRCLQGDGGVLNGAVPGVAGIEADALVIAESLKQISGPASKEQNIISMQIEGPDADTPNTNRVPEWALPLAKVRQLPTNVGSRIRECIYEALKMDPPAWARDILDRSISKSIYRHNASGPTKKLALKVLEDSSTYRANNEGHVDSRQTPISHVVMRKCRFILREAFSVCTSKSRKLCYLLGSSLIYPNEGGLEGIIGFPAMVSRPIDFRTIDKRLSLGIYGGSHEAFHEDVQEVLFNLRMALAGEPERMEEVEKLSERFQSLYDNEVLDLVKKIALCMENTGSDPEKELAETLNSLKVLPKAPWDVEICMICGVDRDDRILLLCDTCNSGYHIYCLDPPLPRVPKGSWHCLNCSKYKSKGKEKEGEVEKKENVSDDNEKYHHKNLDWFLRSMGEMEYSELQVEQRTFLLKFLCDELVRTTLLRSHIEKHAMNSSEFREKLHLLNRELRNPRITENQIFQDIVTDLESQIRRLSVRTQLIGTDYLKRLYWFHIASNKRPCLVVEHNNNNNNNNTDSVNKPQSFIRYESNDDIKGLINWLNVCDPSKKDLKDSILTVQRLIFHQEDSSSYTCLSSLSKTDFVPNLATKALKVLEFMHKPCLNEPPKIDGPMGLHRCSCLEPVWATKNHCFSCHQTFTTILEAEAHNNNEKCTDSIDRSEIQPELVHEAIQTGSSKINKGASDEIIRLLKMNLLDMQAAMSEERFRLTQSEPSRRRKWRSFVKAAESIYELVQATILLEEMIKSKYIKNEWWHWSSHSAASKTRSITAFALRIYTLDDCLIYLTDPPPI